MDGDKQVVLQHKLYENVNYKSFTEVLKIFLEQDARIDRAPDCACIAVAGPVRDNKVRFTNRDSWSVDGEELQTVLGIGKVQLVNDFVALGYGLLTLDHDKECVVLQSGVRSVKAPIACIGAGDIL